MADTLSLLSLIAFVLAGVCLLLAATFFVIFRIPSVIGDLSGRNARKSIARMRSSNEKSGNKSYRESKTNAARGKLTSTMPGIGAKPEQMLSRARAPAVDQNPETDLIGENKANTHEESTVLLADTKETVLLAETPKVPAKRIGGVRLSMIDEVMLVHSEEIIA